MRLSAGFCSGLIGSCPTSCSARGVAVCVLCLTTFGAPHCQQCAYRSSIPVPQLLQRHITGADIIPSAGTVKAKTNAASKLNAEGVNLMPEFELARTRS